MSAHKAKAIVIIYYSGYIEGSQNLNISISLSNSSGLINNLFFSQRRFPHDYLGIENRNFRNTEIMVLN